METMRLRGACGKELMLATHHGSLALRRLRHLLIGDPEGATGTIMSAPTFAWVLSRAENLQLLSVALGKFSFLPPLTRLRHLALTFVDFPRDFQSISHAVSLETLMIDCRKVLIGPGPNLQLENTKGLQRLALRNILPADLQVWEGCSVFVEGIAVLSMPDEDWSSKVAESISYMRIADRSMNWLAVPARFARLQNLQVVYLALGRLGAEGNSVPLQDSLANVRRLSIVADDLFITVPATVQWEEVHFGGEKALCINFVDVKAFVSSCSRFATAYKSLIGTWMPILCQCLAAQGLPFQVEGLSRVRSLLFRGEADFSKCLCGACLRCLAQSQEALGDWAT